jgi:hypothetical protein
MIPPLHAGMMMIIIIGMVALSVDFGNAYVKRRNVIRAANAAALVGMESLLAGKKDVDIGLALKQSLESNGKNEEAGRYFEKYKELKSGDPRGARYISSVKNFSDFFLHAEDKRSYLILPFLKSCLLSQKETISILLLLIS